MLARHLATKFGYNKAKNMYVADASELTEGGKRPLFGRVYDDACDEGFAMISETGREAKFAVDNEVRHADNDVTHWVLVPTADTIRKLPMLRGATVTIFND